MEDEFYVFYDGKKYKLKNQNSKMNGIEEIVIQYSFDNKEINFDTNKMVIGTPILEESYTVKEIFFNNNHGSNFQYSLNPNPNPNSNKITIRCNDLVGEVKCYNENKLFLDDELFTLPIKIKRYGKDKLYFRLSNTHSEDPPNIPKAELKSNTISFQTSSKKRENIKYECTKGWNGKQSMIKYEKKNGLFGKSWQEVPITHF